MTSPIALAPAPVERTAAAKPAKATAETPFKSTLEQVKVDAESSAEPPSDDKAAKDGGETTDGSLVALIAPELMLMAAPVPMVASVEAPAEPPVTSIDPAASTARVPLPLPQQAAIATEASIPGQTAPGAQPAASASPLPLETDSQDIAPSLATAAQAALDEALAEIPTETSEISEQKPIKTGPSPVVNQPMVLTAEAPRASAGMAFSQGEHKGDSKGDRLPKTLDELVVRIADEADQPETVPAERPESLPLPETTSSDAELTLKPWELTDIRAPKAEAAPVKAEPIPFKEAIAKPFIQVQQRPDAPAELRLRLNPENLGRLDLTVTAQDGAIHAKIRVDHPQVREMLETQLASLRQTLADQGIKIERLEVSINGQPSDRGGFSFAGGHPGQGQSHSNPSSTPMTFRNPYGGDELLDEEPNADVPVIGQVDYQV